MIAKSWRGGVSAHATSQSSLEAVVYFPNGASAHYWDNVQICELSPLKCVLPDISGDVTGDGCVDFDDILLVLSKWDTDGSEGGDNDCSGLVDFDDLLAVLSAFGDGECG